MRIPAIRINQWLTEWDSFRYRPQDRQRKPKKYFYLASIPVSLLRRLSNIPRRGVKDESGRQQATGLRAEDIGIQRGFEEKRTQDIQNFVNAGYPYADLRKVEQDKFPELKKPGWLATALVVNVVGPTTSRKNLTPDANDLIRIEVTGQNTADLVLPSDAESPQWQPKGKIHPLEVIDGQHRLLAFGEKESIDGNFDLPVVLFEDLDISWQAYLFWTINITPKRIGPSLAYDLYPLLRTEDWLEPVPGPLAYRETRAQELTEALWSNPDSPWYERIGMLGRERGKVTQAAFVRSLSLSFIRRPDIGGGRPGGLFGASLSNDQIDVLGWSRSQQAAYLIYLWSELEHAIKCTDAAWAQHVRDNTKTGESGSTDGQDPAFSGIYSLLATDQGVRGFLQVSNDVSFYQAKEIGLPSWIRDFQGAATESTEVSEAARDLKSRQQIAAFVRELSEGIAKFDWSSSVTPGLTEETRNRQALYRAGSGYREARRQLSLHLSRHANGTIQETAKRIVKKMKFGQ